MSSNRRRKSAETRLENSLAEVGVDFRFVWAHGRRLKLSLLILLVVVLVVGVDVDFTKRRTRSILRHIAECEKRSALSALRGAAAAAALPQLIHVNKTL
jgi:hypothetical protein